MYCVVRNCVTNPFSLQRLFVVVICVKVQEPIVCPHLGKCVCVCGPDKPYCNESLLALGSICSLFIKQEKFQSQNRAKPKL